MEITKTDVAKIEEAIAKATDSQVRELNSLQLTLVGGGSGEVSPY